MAKLDFPRENVKTLNIKGREKKTLKVISEPQSTFFAKVLEKNIPIFISLRIF